MEQFKSITSFFISFLITSSFDASAQRSVFAKRLFEESSNLNEFAKLIIAHYRFV